MTTTVDIIEARMTSSRLPGKVMLECQGRPMLGHMIERLKRARTLDGIVVATTTNAADDVLEDLAHKHGVGCFRGSEGDVLDRVLQAAHKFNVDVIVETPGDCPCIDWTILDDVVEAYRERRHDYVSNNLKPSYPGGMDVQVFSTAVLEDVARRTDDPVDHEHVSLYIYRHPEIYKSSNVEAPEDQRDPGFKFLLDTSRDFELICATYDALYPTKPDFTCRDIIGLMRHRPYLQVINADVQRTKV
jgi:spore coat polysaccharide biosynthesis protein SpsF